MSYEAFSALRSAVLEPSFYILLQEPNGNAVSIHRDCFDLKDYLLSIHSSETEIFCKPFAINTM